MERRQGIKEEVLENHVLCVSRVGASLVQSYERGGWMAYFGSIL